MVLVRSDLQKRFFVLHRLCLSLAERANSKRRTSVPFHSIFFWPISFFTKKIILSDGIQSQVAQIIPKQLILSKTSFFFKILLAIRNRYFYIGKHHFICKFFIILVHMNFRPRDIKMLSFKSSTLRL